MANTDPSTPSSAYKKMKPVWDKIDHIIAGADKVREQAEIYLPKYAAEDKAEYARRLMAAPWRPEFTDALQSLASKPFRDDVSLREGASPALVDFADDVDSRRNDLTAFSREVFYGGLAKGMHAILVDYPSIADGATLDDERQLGARPYWVSIPAEEIIALYTDFVAGREIVTHVRLKETMTVRDGFGEASINRVRILEPGGWQLWQEVDDGNYEMVAEGPLSLPEVPLAIFWTGDRIGSHFVRPPLRDLADMQIELYRALSREDEILTYAGSPMLSAQGIARPDDGATLQVGPKRVLFAPPGADGGQTGWSYVQPDAANIKETREHVQKVQEDMRRLGMQPLMQKSGNPTATAASVEAAKAHSAVQAWATGLRDTLELAFWYTSLWMGNNEDVTVSVTTDFAVDAYAQAPLQALKDAFDAQAIPLRDYIVGLVRFSVLPPDTDIDELIERLLAELPGDDSADDIIAAATPAAEPLPEGDMAA